MNNHDTLLLSGGTARNRNMLRSILGENFNLLEAANSRQTLVLLQQNLDCIAAVLLDVTDPEGYERGLLEQEAEMLSRVGVIVITGGQDHALVNRAYGCGAADVIPLNHDSDAMIHRIRNIVELRMHKQELEKQIQEQAELLRHSNDTMVDALSSIIEYRSVETGQHILRIRHFTRILLEEVARGCPEYGLTEEQIQIISSAAALHDVGKIAIPDAILMKPGKLTPQEWEIMKTHSITGCEILGRIGDMGYQGYLRYAHNICHYHHERWDGGGYPEGLAGDEIPICAQVVGLADAYDALTTKRVYKDAYSFETAANMILGGECGAFSPKLLECFKRVTHRYEALALAYSDGLLPQSEDFDTTLPGPGELKVEDSVEFIRAKYLALVHYLNAFLIELDMDKGLFHLVYNPFPEMSKFQQINTLDDICQLLLNQLVIPQEREQMADFLYREIPAFLDRHHRRSGFLFQFQGKSGPEPFELTLLRVNPNAARRTLAVLCRRVNQLESSGGQPILADSTYVCLNDSDFTLDHISGETRVMAGYTQQELMETFGGRLIELIHPEDREMVRNQFTLQLYQGSTVELEHRVCRRDGTVLWVLNKSRLMVENGEERIHSFLTDITRTRKNLDQINQKLRRYEIILAQTENVLFEWDVEEDTISFSETWERIFGFQPISRDVDREVRGGAHFHPDDLPNLLGCIRNLRSGAHYGMVEVRIAASGGRYLWCRFRASALRDESGRLQKIVGIIINIDVEKMAERALQDRAERDALTKLLNKAAGRKHAEVYFAQYPQGAACAMLVIDLDNFKQVNDEFGHLFGDAVLTRVARELKKLFHAQDILARIGGDEFLVLMRGVSDRHLVEERCRKLLRVLENAFQEQGRRLPMSCSIGIAMGPASGRTYHELFQRADQALYQAKDRGRNCYVFDSGGDFPRLRKRPAKRIDSDQRPGLADNSIVQFAFQRLYSSEDMDSAIQDVLRLVGEQMNVSRVYVFENSQDNLCCSNTFEWCNVGITPEIQNLQNIPYSELKGFLDQYDEEGILYCPDIAALSPEVRDVVEPQGIKSMLQCAIREQGVFRGYIGFDECINQRLWTKEQIRTLTYFSEMLSVFLLKNRAQERTHQRASDLSSILDNQNAWIYIIDPETCELRYLNAKTRALATKAREGMRCHEALMGQPDRCPGCPAREIYRNKTASALLRNGKFDLDVVAEATKISWEGQPACLLTCREKELKL